MGALALAAWRRDLLAERRTYGWMGMLRRRGWKLLAAVVAYYLVRDLLLYVVIPIAIYRGLGS